MILEEIEHSAVYTYQLPLKKPIAARGSNAYIRSGILVFIRNRWGVGIGEAAPIDGFHPISLKETQEEIIHALRNPHKHNSIHAISQCAIEMAMQPPTQEGSVDVNGLITQSSNIDTQFSCYKIKVGRQSVREDILMVQSILQQLPPQTPIRLDANCAWSYAQCMEFWMGIDGTRHNIEYIEEPLHNPQDYNKLSIPFAFDERLSIFADQLHTFPTLRAIILKPSLLGFQSCHAWMKRAKKHQIMAVISSTFESSVGLFAYAGIAQKQPQTYCGLATGAWLCEDFMSVRALPLRGTLTIPKHHHWIGHPSLKKVST